LNWGVELQLEFDLLEDCWPDVEIQTRVGDAAAVELERLRPDGGAQPELRQRVAEPAGQEIADREDALSGPLMLVAVI
jgi:hypothetical protein